MFNREDLPEKAALVGAVALAVGVMLWQVLPTIIPGLSQGGADGDGADGSEAAVPLNRKSDDTPLPWNTKLVKGQLDNGLSYFVLPHKKPEQRAQLWLVVKAGSVLEDEDQRGLAHFVEHMAFNGTAKYEKQAIINYLEKELGMRFGPEINAETGFDRTVYKLKVPTDDPAAIAKGLDFLHEWASAISFDPKEVDAERGVVLEEWRAGRGAMMRMMEKLLPTALAGSKYPERLPIGTPESIKGSPREALVRYYKDWYRPDLMAVIAVGDLDAPAVEKQIQSIFGDLKGPPNPRKRERAEVPAHKDPRAGVIQDDEADQPILVIIDKVPYAAEHTYGDLRDGAYALAAMLSLNQRFNEISQKPDAPFTMAGSAPDTTQMVESLSLIQTAAIAKNDRVSDAVETVLMEMARAEKHGFLPEELERTAKQLSALLSVAANRYDYQDSEEMMPTLVDHFMRGGVFVGKEIYEEMSKELAKLSAEQVNGAVAKIVSERSRALLLLAPKRVTVPSKAAVTALMARIGSMDLQPWGGRGAAKPLMSETPQPGSITKTTERKDIGVVEWTLSNGARVVVKQTDFEDDEILMQATAAGGSSTLAEDDIGEAQFVGAITDESGMGTLDRIELVDSLAGKVASVGISVDDDKVTIGGQTRPADLETFMQMIHLRSVGIRDDAKAFERWQSRARESVANTNSTPKAKALNKWIRALMQNHPRTQPTTVELVDSVSHDRVKAIYKQLFSDAGDFTFVFVGDVDPKILKPLVETYLASLPSTLTRETGVDTGERVKPGIAQMREQGGQEPQATSITTFHGIAPWTWAGDVEQSLVIEIAKLRLRIALREEESGTYGTGVQGRWADGTSQGHRILVSFVAEPKRVPALHRKMLAEIAKIRAGNVPAEDFEKVRETWKREHEEALKKNAFWRRVLARTYRRGSDIKTWLNIDAKLAMVSADTLKKAAPVHLPAASRFDFVLDPDPAALKKAAAENKQKDAADKAKEAADKAKEAADKAKEAAEAQRKAKEAADAAKKDAPGETKPAPPAPPKKPSGGYLQRGR